MPTSFVSNWSTGFRFAIPNLTKPQITRACNCSVPRRISNFSFVDSRNCKQISRPLTMATSGTKAAAGDLVVDSLISSCGNLQNIALPSGVYFGDRSLRYCQKATLGLKHQSTISGNNSCTSYRFHSKPRSWDSNSNSFAGLWLSGLHASSVQCYSEGAVPSMSLDGPGYDEQSAVLTEKDLKLQSGSCYLPHPDKVKTGGEDAHFICKDEQAIGVADGVGGWAEIGVNAGVYARELMSNSVSAIQHEPRGSIDPARVLEKAHLVTKEKGSSTACIITLTEQNLHAINLGDSGFIVVRDGRTIFESPVQQHGFNFTYQLEDSKTGDLPSSGQVFMIPVVPGDVIVAGTDGLFDNLYNNEITAVVVEGLSSGLGPQETAQQIAALARERALDRKRRTPFSRAAQEAGYSYFGGKLDDTTVVVSFVTSSTSM